MSNDHDRDHDHDDGHDHDHDHDHRHGGRGAVTRGGVFTPKEAKQARRLLTVLAMIACFVVVELAGAISARSQVLQADAVHLLMDVFALGMAVTAMRLAVTRPTDRFTFGMRRAEPVAAIFNGLLVLAATAFIVREGIAELAVGGAPRPNIMLVVASAALVVNGLSAWLLHDVIKHGDHAHAHAHDPDNPDDEAHEREAASKGTKRKGHALNLRGAWLHLLGDALGSLAALVAAVVIRAGGPAAVDPIASFLVAGILVFGAVKLIRDATLVLLEAAPRHLPVTGVRAVILEVAGVVDVHDMHVWTLGAGHDAITVHVRAADNDPSLSGRVSKRLRDDFDVEYVTVQVEVTDSSCGAPPSHFKG